MSISNNDRKLAVQKMRWDVRRTDSPKKFGRWFADGVIVATMIGTIFGSAWCSHYQKKEKIIAAIKEDIKKEVKDRDIDPKERKEGFCAVKCSQKSEGPFHMRLPAYEANLSEDKKIYKKLFYNKEGKRILEATGSNGERWFMNPNWDGDSWLVRAINTNDRWLVVEEHRGERADEVWKKVKSGSK